jgi:hypothetical protein
MTMTYLIVDRLLGKVTKNDWVAVFWDASELSDPLGPAPALELNPAGVKPPPGLPRVLDEREILRGFILSRLTHRDHPAGDLVASPGIPSRDDQSTTHR